MSKNTFQYIDDFIIVSKFYDKPFNHTSNGYEDKTYEHLIHISSIKHVEEINKDMSKLHFINDPQGHEDKWWYIKETPRDIQSLIDSKLNNNNL